MHSFFPFQRSFRPAVCLGTAVALLGLSGCSGVAPSQTVKGAGVGTAIGAGTGAIVGNNSSIGSGAGILGGAVGGALVGGIVGMVQDARDRKEQDRLAQERSYQQEMAKKRAEEARLKSEMDEELQIAQGFRITEIELNDAKRKYEVAADKLKKLESERAGAIAKKKELDETREKTLATEAKIAQLEEELARLKGEDVQVPATNAPAPGANASTPAPGR
jgi:hypothetical protein